MSLDLSLISAIIHEKDYLKVVDHGITRQDIDGDSEGHIFKFIHTYHQEYRTTPSFALIEQKFNLKLPVVEDSLDFMIKEIGNRTLERNLEDLFVSVNDRLRVDDPKEAESLIISFAREQQLKQSNEIKLVSIMDLKDAVIKRYEDAKAGKMGVLTPWPIMNEWTGGWQPTDLTFFIARSGVGKTWIVICLANAARESRKNVLIISGEMSDVLMGFRFYGMEIEKPYRQFSKGRLSIKDEQEAMQSIRNFKLTEGQNFQLLDAKFCVDSVSIERAIDKARPDLVLIDSAYRIKPRQKARDIYEAMSYVANELKSIALNYNVPIVATHQVNREGGKKKKGAGMSQEDVSMSDVINWNSSNVFGLTKVDDKVAIYPIKVRENENDGKPLVIKCDLVNCDFGQIGLAESVDKIAEAKEEDDGRSW